MVRMRVAERSKLVRGTTVLERAAGVHVRKDDDLLGRKDFRGLSHEAHAAEGNDVGIRLRGLAGQVETVADEVGKVLDFGLLIVMSKDDGVALAFQALD